MERKKGWYLPYIGSYIDTITPVLPVRNAAQARARAETNAAGDDAPLIADDVTE